MQQQPTAAAVGPHGSALTANVEQILPSKPASRGEEQVIASMTGSLGSREIFSVFVTNFPFRRLRSTSSIGVPFLWPPGGFWGLNSYRNEPDVTFWEDKDHDTPQGPYGEVERGAPRKETVSACSPPSWSSLLIPMSHGEEAGHGAPLLLDEEGRYLPDSLL